VFHTAEWRPGEAEDGNLASAIRLFVICDYQRRTGAIPSKIVERQADMQSASASKENRASYECVCAADA
jgi:hypothetical protein